MPEQIISTEELNKLKSFSSPGKLIKKALSSIFVVLMIGAGLVLNWVMALIYLFGAGSSASWLWYIVGLGGMIAIFPILYVFFAYSYGQGVLLWEAYREVLRPLAGKLFSSSLDKYLVDNPNQAGELNEEAVHEEIANQQQGFLDRIPDFIKSYVQIFFTGKDIINIVREQRKTGADKTATKEKAMSSFYQGIDTQMSELIEPSLIPFYIVGAINLVFFYFLF